MRKYTIVLSLLFFLIFIDSTQCRAASDWTGNLNLFYGMRSGANWPVNTSDEDMSKQNLIGCNIDFGKKSWPVNIAIGFIQSSKNATFKHQYILEGYSNKYEVSTTEIKFGVKKIWKTSINLNPYIGIEGALIDAEEKGSGFSNEYNGTFSGSGHSLGLNGGLCWTLANHFNLGVELGFLSGKANLDPNEDVSLTSSQMALFIGYHW
jgi:hypothetical protein